MKANKSHIEAPERDQFPGYPLYAPKDDIMSRAKRVDVNAEEDAVSGKITTEPGASRDLTISSDESKPRNEADVTAEDLEALGPKDLSLDMGDDEELKHRTEPVDFTGKDLDIPGSELDDAREAVGAEDEENNGYSIGGDRHEDLEEDRS